jgi:rSAM-associated Gly-rich repeat protein
MGSLLASNLAHLAETAMMLTLVQQMVTDALETEDPDTRKEIQVRAESVLNMVDNSQAQQTTLVQLAIQQNAQQALYLNGNGNGYTNGYENGNGYTNGNGYANGYLESLAERFVPVDSTSLGIEVDLSAGREAISRQLSNIEAALTTVVAQRQGLQQNQGRLNHARASLSQNPGA